MVRRRHWAHLAKLLIQRLELLIAAKHLPSRRVSSALHNILDEAAFHAILWDRNVGEIDARVDV